jgi:hypothetical protein
MSSLLYTFNFKVQNYNVIVIENVFLLSVLKIRLMGYIKNKMDEMVWVIIDYKERQNI